MNRYLETFVGLQALDSYRDVVFDGAVGGGVRVQLLKAYSLSSTEKYRGSLLVSCGLAQGLQQAPKHDRGHQGRACRLGSPNTTVYRPGGDHPDFSRRGTGRQLTC